MSSMTLSAGVTRNAYAASPRAAVRPVTSRPAAPAGVRLTRRGRLVVFLACLALVLGTALFLGATSVATDQAGADVPTELVVVGPGDTLWDIAAARSDAGEVRQMMNRIEELNALDTTMLMAGQRLHVPVAD